MMARGYARNVDGGDREVFVYVDSAAYSLSEPISPAMARVGRCHHCGGVHFLKRDAWAACSNPRCIPDPHGNVSGTIEWQDGPWVELMLATLAVGGVYAVLDILEAEGG